MKRVPLLVLAASLVCIAVVVLRDFGPEPAGPEAAGNPSGAMQALDFWAAARAYPHRAIPDAGFASAFFAAKRRPLRATGIDAAVSPWDCLGPENIGGRTLALAWFDGTVRFLSLPGGMYVGRTLFREGCQNSVAFRPDGRAVAATGAPWRPEVWDLVEGRKLYGTVNLQLVVRPGDSPHYGYERQSNRLSGFVQHLLDCVSTDHSIVIDVFRDTREAGRHWREYNRI